MDNILNNIDKLNLLNHLMMKILNPLNKIKFYLNKINFYLTADCLISLIRCSRVVLFLFVDKFVEFVIKY